MARRTRRRRVCGALLALLAFLAVVGGLFLVSRLGADNGSPPAVAPEGAGTIRIVGASTESAWWMTPRVSIGPSAVTVAIPASVLFALDSTRIGDSGLSSIDEVTALFRARPGSHVIVACYTDVTGTANWNLTLSQGRARSIVAALGQAGVPSIAVSATGYGASQFVASNATPTGRALNRRCSLTVLSGNPTRAP